MDSVEILIPDNVGNYLVVVLTFYDDINKSKVLNIPPDLADFELADISIRKLDLDKPLTLRAFNEMCDWLVSQFCMFPKAIFSFVCSFSEVRHRADRYRPEEYRWKLFDTLIKRKAREFEDRSIHFSDIIIGFD